MNKKVLWLLIVLFSVVHVNAASFDMVCPTKVKKGQTITIPVYVNRGASESTISGVSGTFSYNSGQLQLGEYNSTPNNWTISSSTNTFSLGDSTFSSLLTGNRPLVFNTTFTVSNDVTSSIDLSIINPEMTGNTGQAIPNVSGDSCTMNLVSENNDLSNITLSSGTLSPSFSSSVTSYNATVDAETVTVNYTLADNSATPQCDCNNVSLKYGENKIIIKVTSEAGVSKNYTITITRPDNRDTNNNLKSLTLSKGTLYFEKNKTDYNVNVEGDVDKIIITSSLDSSKATYVDWLPSKEVTLKYGLNTFKIVVKAENETTKTYKIDITRKDNRDSNNNLSELKITPGTIDFDPKVLEYKVNVKYDVETVKIETKPASKKANVTVDGPDKLVIGENIYTITVTAENESKKEYKITVIRNEENTSLSSIALLDDLSIEGYDFIFDPDIFEYEITSNEKEFKVMASAQENGTVYVVNDGKVDDNNNIIVRVTAEDGTVNKYIIHVNASQKKKIKITTIIIIILSLFIVGAVIYLIANNKDDKKKPDSIDKEVI